FYKQLGFEEINVEPSNAELDEK
ncbi:MAG: hypothetical protein RLZ33_2592, partial [Bacteroidota bacterium]